MSFPRMNGHCDTEPGKSYVRAGIPFGTVVSLDRNEKRWPHLGTAVRRPEPGDTFEDIFGVVMDGELHGLVDIERPGASGAGTVACGGLAWARCVGPVAGAVVFPIDISQYAEAPSGDQLGLVLGGPHAGSVRRFESGDIAVGGAVAVEDDFVLVRLALPYKKVIGGLGCR